MISWVAGAIELLAKWLCGNKNRWGWIFHLISGILWLIVAFTNLKVAGGLLIIVIPSIYINLRNYLKWSRDEKEQVHRVS
jgi:nicotinamide riboside transporter PnuC